MKRLTIEQIAKVCHQANKAYCEAIGDLSQVNWDEAPQWQRHSAIKGVEFALNHPNATPRDQHESWTEQKFADGWTWGEVKDAEKKTHPNLLPYEQLPAEQQAKDSLFRAIVESLREMI
jgi:hypothetical protein